MAKIDPKLLKKISQSGLIAAAGLIKVKNAEKLSKESLVTAFIKAVEAVPQAEQENLDGQVVDVYNNVVKTLGLVEGGEEAPKKEEKASGKGKKTAKGKEKEEEPRYSRFDALADTFKEMKKGGKIADLVAKSYKRHTDAGGGGTDARMRFFARGVLKTLSSLGYAEVDDENFKPIK